MNVGIGYDAHAFVPGMPLILGGVTVPHDRGLAGHSDADVLSHAITDAVLGAAALGDMGQHFPSSEPEWAGADSLQFVRRAALMLSAIGLRVDSVDSTVVCEAPSLAPFREEMRRRLADAIGTGVGSVSVKFSTNDGMGFLGRGEGIAAMAVVVVMGSLG